MRQLVLQRGRSEQPDTGPLLLARLGEGELAAAFESEPERGRLRALRAGGEVAEAAGAHQVHAQDELAVAGREEEGLATPSGADESSPLELAERWIERLQ